jgi:hypothetical protein
MIKRNKKEKNMKRFLLSSVFAGAFATSAMAGGLDVAAETVEVVTVSNFTVSPVVTGSIEVEVAENDAGDYAATTTFNAGIVTPGLVFGEIGVESVDGNTFEIDTWHIGAVVGSSTTLSFGDHGGVFIGAYSDYATVVDPDINEALIVTLGDASAALGFTDITNDVTDISNVQGAYTLDAGLALVTVSADYNFISEEFAVGTRTDGVLLGPVELGSTLSYFSETEVLAYEMDATMSYGLTAYVNGDNDDALRNVGAGYERALGNMTVFASVNYDLNTEEVEPKAGITFSF